MSKLFNGDDTFSDESLDFVTYPELVKRVDYMIKNQWIPQEIGVGDDILAYTQLEPNGQNNFHIQFGKLSFMDRYISTPLGLLVSLSTNSELSTMINRMIREEEIHFETYKLIAETTRIDTSILFNRHRTNPQIIKLVELSKRYYNYIADYFIYTNNHMGGYNEKEYKKVLKNLCKGIFYFSQCYEGLIFMCGFPPIFSLCEKGLMLRTAEQLKYIWRDENLHVSNWLLVMEIIKSETGVVLTPDEIVNIITESVSVEEEYATKNFLPIPGYNYVTHCRYVKHTANLRIKTNLQALHPGAYEEPHYKDAEYPGFLSKYQLVTENDFFSRSGTNYQVVNGGLDWGDHKGIDIDVLTQGM